MSSPESADFEYLPQQFYIPDNPIAALISEERRERKEAFVQLRQQVERVEALGKDDTSSESLHRVYLDGGVKQTVLFRADFYSGHGRVYRVIVNDESQDHFGNRSLLMEDYLLSARSDEISYTWQKLWRPRADHAWSNLDDIRAPLLQQRADFVQIRVGANYKVCLPESAGGDYLEVMDRRRTAIELAGVLENLSTVTREDNIFTG
jgi:hypothetical protein